MGRWNKQRPYFLKTKRNIIKINNMNYKEIIKNAIDLHIHIGPEIIPRKFTLPELLKYEKGKLKGVGVKNHFFPTISMCRKLEVNEPFVIDSVVLNSYSGGLNPDIIYASAQLSRRPIIVWFPTLQTKSFLKSQKFEIAKEWIDQKLRGKINLRKSKNIKPILIFDSKGKIRKETESVLLAIKKTGAILATGHLSWQDASKLVEVAIKKFDIKKVIITHPIYQKINMPISMQNKLASMGAIIEQCYSMHSIDKIPIKKISEQIKLVGAKNCIMSSDVGQKFSKSPSESLADFVRLLEKEGIIEEEIKIMLIKNPVKLVA